MGPTDLPLFRAWPGLRDRLPRASLGDWPTPLQSLQRFAADTRTPNLWVKREDLSRSAGGGNKVRGLEFLLGAAHAARVDEILTIGAAGSFHVRATAVGAASLGMRVTALVVHQPNAAYVSRNLAAAIDAGAHVTPVRLPALPFAFALRWLAARRGGRRACVIPPGGTSPLACIGHVNAFLELKEQIDRGEMPRPETIFVPLGSLGTAAGLAAGMALSGLPCRIVGVNVFSRWYCTRGRWRRLAEQTLRLLRSLDDSVPQARIDASCLTVEHGELGPGYAHFTEAGVAAAHRLFEAERIPVDGTYTAKMYAAVLKFLTQSPQPQRNVLVWHTYSRGPSPNRPQQVPAGLERYFSQPCQPLDGRLPADA